MKFTKTLAAITAAAMAVTMAAIPASAEKTINGVEGNFELEVAGFLPEGRTVADVYGATVQFDDASAEVIAAGAGGGFIWNGENCGWAQQQWCNGCTEEEAHDIQYDAETNTITRLDETAPFVDGEGWSKIALVMWWGGDIKVTGITLLDAEGNALEAAATTPEEPTPGTSTEVPEEPATDVLPGDSELPSEVKEIEIKPGKMFNDGGWRVNLVHPWAAEEDKEAANIVDAQAFAGTTQISVVFKATNVTEPFTAWLAFATNDDTGLAYWGDGNAANSGVTQVPVKVDKDGYYTVTLTTDVPVTVGDNFFLALQTDNKNEENAPVIELVKVGAAEAVAVDPIVPGASSEEPQNPGTGVTLVVVPAALAAAALATSGIVLKKRSK